MCPGISDAALGHKEDAIREGRRAVGLLPVTKDMMAEKVVPANPQSSTLGLERKTLRWSN